MSSSLRRVLVTGASGFLGAHVVRSLVKRGVAVVAQGRDAARLSFTGNVIVAQCTLADVLTLTEAARGCDAVVHAAALSAPWGARQDFIDANVTGTANVIVAARTCGVQRLVHISSPAVLFDGTDQHMVDDSAPVPARLGSEYARTKHAAELLVGYAASEMETIILRPKAIYGEGDRALVPRLVRAARSGRLPQIGDGNNAVDVTHVDDVVQAIQRALVAQRGFGESFLVTGGEHVPLWAMIRELLGGVGAPLPSRTISLRAALSVATVLEAIAAVTRREPTLTRYSAQILARTQTYDITRARTVLGYAPRVSATQGLARTIDAMRAGTNGA